MAHMLQDIPKCRSLMEKGEPGVITTHKRKELYSNTVVERFAGSGNWRGHRQKREESMGTKMLNHIIY